MIIKKIGQPSILGTMSLFESINGLLKSTYLMLQVLINKPRWLCHVNILERHWIYPIDKEATDDEEQEEKQDASFVVSLQG